MFIFHLQDNKRLQLLVTRRKKKKVYRDENFEASDEQATNINDCSNQMNRPTAKEIEMNKNKIKVTFERIDFTHTLCGNFAADRLPTNF